VRTLALDIGEKRIGVAISDPLGTIAQPLMTIENNAETLAKIAGIVQEREIGEIVVGLPVNMNGTAGPKAQEVREFARKVTEAIDIAVVFVDERLTTAEAEKLMISADVSRQKRRQSIDSVAAAIILEKRLREKTGGV
jgi:putative Holliday junction resolvase